MPRTLSHSALQRFALGAPLFLAPLLTAGCSQDSPSPENDAWPVRVPRATPVPSRNITSLAFSSDGHTLAVGNDGGAISLWNIQDGTLIWHKVLQNRIATRVAFSPDGSLLASACGPSLSLWSLPSHRLLKAYDAPLPLVTSLAFSPDNQRLAIASGQNDIYRSNVKSGSLILWNLKTDQKTALLSYNGTQTTYVGSVAFSPDGKSLAATCNQNRTISSSVSTIESFTRLWNMPDAKRLWQGFGYYMADVAFSPDGKFVVSGGMNPLVLDAQTGKLTRAMDRIYGSSMRLAVSADGKVVAGAGMGNSISFWDTTTGHSIEPASPLTSTRATSLAFSRNGKYLVASDGSRKVTIWDSSQLSTRPNLPPTQPPPPLNLLRTIDTF